MLPTNEKCPKCGANLYLTEISATPEGTKIPIIYEGYVEEAPQTTQTVLTEALTR